jgi:hypothetical protein
MSAGTALNFARDTIGMMLVPTSVLGNGLLAHVSSFQEMTILAAEIRSGVTTRAVRKSVGKSYRSVRAYRLSCICTIMPRDVLPCLT